MKRAKQKRTAKKTRVTKPKHNSKPFVKVAIVKKTLGKAPEKYSFNLQDGRKLRSIYELIDELETMTDETFRQYATDFENHFANWIEHVFSEKSLAEEIRHVHNRIDAQRALLKHLVRELTKKAHA
jgi:hypothetical protein